MAFSSYLSLKPQLAEFRNGPDRDNMSEVSDSGTGGSMNSVMGSAEELQKVALILNISAEDVAQDRFRVDRRKLEGMLSENVSEEESANNFFQQVMEETSTVINWPTRLKVGAKSKKDPHVRVAGRTESVKMARDRIMQILDTRCNRVTMKLDVSYTDHSHIIGKGGLTIKRVMEETGCHIHFPDSNRSNPMEKSNQVSIAGDMDNVERARARVRALTPLIFSFELPIMSSSQALPDASTPYVVQIQEKYNVQVMLRTRPKLHATLVMVKGQQWEVQGTMEATTLLINYMCGNLAQQTLVQMSLEITPMHHQVVLGRAASQLKVIMSNTKTQIMFPDASDPNIPMLKKSNVTITGSIEDVYLARQQLVGSLPLVIMFDLPEDVREIQTEHLTNLMQNLNVYINIRQKPKLCALSVIIKGIERNANDIYEARRHLLNLQEPTVVASIPESYQIPILPGNTDTTSHFNPFSPSHQHNIPQSPMGIAVPLQNLANNASRAYPLPPLRLSDISNFPGLNSPQFNPPTPGGYPSPMSPLNLSPSIFTPSWGLIPPSPQSQNNGNVFQYPGMVMNNPSPTYMQNPQQQQSLWGLPNMMSQATSSNMMTHLQQQLGVQQYCAANTVDPGRMHTHSMSISGSQPHSMSNSGSQPNSLGQLLNVSSQASSGYHSNFTGSSASLDVHSVSGGDSCNSGSNFVSPSVSPISKAHSPAPSPTNTENQNNNNEFLTMISEMTDGDRRAPGYEKKIETIQQSLTPVNDYQKMKIQASKAMKETCAEGYRVPTNRWVGYGFSQTSPSHLLSPNLQHQGSSTVWGTAANASVNARSPHNLTRPNIQETATSPPQEVANICRYQQLSQLLQEKGLEKYIQLFATHEVDIITFSSLTEGDLVEIGVTAFGARKKMLLAISDINKNMSVFSGSAAPGAERKAMRI